MHDMEEVAESGRKAIIFSQWVEPLQVLAEALEPYGPLQYHGRIPQNERTPILDRFKADPTKHVLLMTYGTGSVGLNLQFTNYVFLFDRWWNPAVEDQAINRAHRIGQKHPVTVTRFLSEGTIEAGDRRDSRQRSCAGLQGTYRQAEKLKEFEFERRRRVRTVRHQSPTKAKLNQVSNSGH